MKPRGRRPANIPTVNQVMARVAEAMLIPSLSLRYETVKLPCAPSKPLSKKRMTAKRIRAGYLSSPAVFLIDTFSDGLAAGKRVNTKKTMNAAITADTALRVIVKSTMK